MQQVEPGLTALLGEKKVMVDKLDVVYYPQLGFLISIHVSDDHKTQVSNSTTSQWTHVDGLDFQVPVKLDPVIDTRIVCV
jgi:hypothetical protein